MADLQLANGPSKVWMYMSQYDTPIESGKLRGFHTYDLPLVMRLTLFPETDQLSRQMSEAWGDFARKSDPSSNNLNCRVYTLKNRSTMIFDVDESKVIYNPSYRERIRIDKLFDKN